MMFGFSFYEVGLLWFFRCLSISVAMLSIIVAVG